MRVRYIGDYYKVSLIRGNIYQVIGREKGLYRIVDETNEDFLFWPVDFEIVEGSVNDLPEDKCENWKDVDQGVF